MKVNLSTFVYESSGWIWVFLNSIQFCIFFTFRCWSSLRWSWRWKPWSPQKFPSNRRQCEAKQTIDCFKTFAPIQPIKKNVSSRPITLFVTVSWGSRGLKSCLNLCRLKFIRCKFLLKIILVLFLKRETC